MPSQNPKQIAAMNALPISLLLITSIAALAPPAAAQNCSAGFSRLMACAPFVLPGSAASGQNPSSACCSALRGANTGCLCNTLDIISKLPSACNLSPFTCSG